MWRFCRFSFYDHSNTRQTNVGLRAFFNCWRAGSARVNPEVRTLLTSVGSIDRDTRIGSLSVDLLDLDQCPTSIAIGIPRCPTTTTVRACQYPTNKHSRKNITMKATIFNICAPHEHKYNLGSHERHHTCFWHHTIITTSRCYRAQVLPRGKWSAGKLASCSTATAAGINGSAR